MKKGSNLVTKGPGAHLTLSDVGASSSNVIVYLVDLGGDVFLNYFINYVHFKRKI